MNASYVIDDSAINGDLSLYNNLGILYKSSLFPVVNKTTLVAERAENLINPSYIFKTLTPSGYYCYGYLYAAELDLYYYYLFF